MPTTKRTLKVATRGGTEIVMTRTFDAPRRLVYKAMTTPELVKRWLGGKRAEVVTCEIDLRVGGNYLYVLRLPNGNQMHMRGTYRELGEHRVVYTESFDEFPGESVVTSTLVEHAGATTLTAVAVYSSQQVRDAVIASGMEGGAAESYDKLDGVLAAL
jgi:uncharacterized protein YndB with AHSA1/START domain